MITLTPRAEQQLIVLNTLDRGELLVADAADLLGLSSRQVRRLRRAYRRHGPTALVHGNRGHRSPRRVNDIIRKRIVYLARTTYAGVNHKHLSELLAEREGLTLSHPTIQRMPQAGLLVQLDGSTHAWLEHRGPRLTLIAAIDDATGEVLAVTFRDEEDAHGYFVIFETLTQTKGIPVAAYSDRHGIFHRTTKRPLTLQEQLAGKPAPTQVARALQELGIRWIPARSPQAKGRIERLFGTFQDRLRSELRLAGARDRAGANAFLAQFLPRYNARFTQPAADPTPAYRPWPAGLDPQTVFCFKYQRVVSNDNTLMLGPQCIQLLPGPGGRSYAKATVEVHERRDGRIAVFYRGARLPCRRLTAVTTADRIPARIHPRVHPDPAYGVRVRPGGGIAIATPARKTHYGASERTRLMTNSDDRAKPVQLRKPPAPDHPWRHMPVGKAKPRASDPERTKSLNA